MQKIIFLGTAGDSSVIGRQTRASGGIILQFGETQLHLDPGPGALVRAKEFNVNVRSTTAILVTHPHHFYTNDVNAIIDAMTVGGLDKRGVLVTPQGFSADYVQKDRLDKVFTLEPEGKIGIEDIEVQAIAVNSKDPHTLGYLISSPKAIIGYATESAYTASLAKRLAGSDILIISVRHPGEETAEAALNRASAIKLIERVRPHLAVITGFGLSMLKANPIEEAREIQRATGIQTIAANDGFSLAPATYDAKSRQQRLGSFNAAE